MSSSPYNGRYYARGDAEKEVRNYKHWQRRYKELVQVSNIYWRSWSDEEKRDHLENMQIAVAEELAGRERARELFGERADAGHDERINTLRNQDLSLRLAIERADEDDTESSQGVQDEDPDLLDQLEDEDDESWRWNGSSPPTYQDECALYHQHQAEYNGQVGEHEGDNGEDESTSNSGFGDPLSYFDEGDYSGEAIYFDEGEYGGEDSYDYEGEYEDSDLYVLSDPDD